MVLVPALAQAANSSVATLHPWDWYRPAHELRAGHPEKSALPSAIAASRLASSNGAASTWLALEDPLSIGPTLRPVASSPIPSASPTPYPRVLPLDSANAADGPIAK